MADPQAPWTSGSEILQNTGNAGLASGSGSGVLPIQVDAKPIYSVLDRLGDEDVKMRFQKHLEARADAESLSKTISDIDRQGGSLFNMKGADGSNISYNILPDDHKVAAGMADDLRRMAWADPGNYEQNPIYKRKLYEYNYAVQHAQKRAVAYANNRLAAQQALDPDDRAGYLNANKTQIDDHPLTDLHNPESYIPKQTVDRSTYFDSKLASDKDNFESTTAIGKNPNDPNDPQGYEISKSRLKNAILDVRANVAPGTKAYTEGVKDYITTVNLLKSDPAEAARIEQDILRINKERGLNIQPYVTVKDGQVLFPTKNGKPDIANFVGAIVAEHYGSESTTSKPTNLDEQRKKEEADIKHQKNSDALGWANFHDKERHEKEMEKAAREKGDAKTADEMAAVNAPVHTYLNFAENARAKATVAIPDQFKSVLTVQGINPDDYTYTPINATDEGVGNIAAVKKVNDKGASVGYGQPLSAVYLKAKTGGPGNDMVAVSYEEKPEHTDKKTSIVTPAEIKWKTIKPNEGVENIIKTGKTGVTDKTLLNVGKSQNKLNEYFGGAPVQGGAPAAPRQASNQRPSGVPTNAKSGKTTYGGKKINVWSDGKKLWNAETGEELK